VQSHIPHELHLVSKGLHVVDALCLDEVSARVHLLRQPPRSEINRVSHGSPHRADEKIRPRLNLVPPLLAPVIIVAGVFRAIDAMRVFDIIFVLTRGGPGGATESLSYYAYMLLFGEGQFGRGSAVSLAMFLLVFTLSALLFRVGRFSRMVLE